LCEATITKELWDVITQVATNAELKDFYDLEVTSAIYYLDSDEESSLIKYAGDIIFSSGHRKSNLFRKISEFSRYTTP
jgi:hypothetical protein